MKHVYTDTYVQHMLYGLLLGDGWMQTQNRGKTYRFRYEQGHCHRDYIHHVYTVLHPWCSPPTRYSRSTRAGQIVHTWRLQSYTMPYFTALAPCLYTPGITGKHVPELYIQQYLSPVGLAYWYMDDGSILSHALPRRYGLCFHTQGFTEGETLNLIHGLQEVYDLQCWIKYNKSKPVIAVSGKSYQHFLDICGQYIHKSIYYKLPCYGRMLMT